MRSWSPLESRADLPRRLSGAGAATSSLLFGPPRIGAFWTAGNPAGIADEIRDERADFSASWGSQRGDYRRPLDPERSRRIQIAAQSWRAFSAGTAALGRIVLDQERLDPGTRAAGTDPFASDPLFSVDTARTGMRRTRAALEGSIGWRLGSWSVGVSPGYEAREGTSTLAAVGRRVTTHTPGLILGASRRLGGIEAGSFVRMRRRAETIRLIPRAGITEAYQLSGYAEPAAIPVSIQPYYRRHTESIRSVGGTLAGTLGRGRWIVYGALDRLRGRWWRQQNDDPPKDSWDADGWSAGGALGTPIGARWLLTVHARLTSLAGVADLALDTLGAVLTADESAWDGEAELRLLPAPGTWTGTVTVGIARESRRRRDVTLQLGTDVKAITPWIGAEIGKDLGERLFGSVAGAVAAYGPTSALPDPALRGPVYRDFIAPDLDLQALSARPWALSLFLRYRVSGTVSLWTFARSERTSPTDPAISVHSPGGSRTALAMRGGVTVLP